MTSALCESRLARAQTDRFLGGIGGRVMRVTPNRPKYAGFRAGEVSTRAGGRSFFRLVRLIPKENELAGVACSLSTKRAEPRVRGARQVGPTKWALP